MLKNTVSVTLSPLTSFDFEEFLKCKPYLALKDERIVNVIVKNVLKTLEKEQYVVWLLDVGSGEATVIGKVCQRLYYHKQFFDFHFLVDCVEPSYEGIEFVQQLSTKVANSGILVRPQHTTIEKFLEVNKGCFYDAIICCHALYHIERKQWKYILQNLMSALRPGGILIVNLVSRNSDIYQIKSELERIEGFERLPKMYESCGFDYYAEDLENVLSQIGHTWKQEIISADIPFSSKDVSDALKNLEGGNNNSALIHFLAFMFRLQINDFTAIGTPILLNLLTHASKGLTFKSMDKMFIFMKEAII
jgi:SAM-dependent methyltransferase